MNPIPYRALDNNSHEIRILEFSKNDSVDNSVFVGTLEHVSLIDAKPYHALSYCWGDPTHPKFLYLRLPSERGTFQKIAITENLHAALSALWSRRGFEEKLLRLWVDALCINQNDLYERSQQVQMMRQIYSRAEKVLAWVGPTIQSVLSPATLQHLSDVASTSVIKSDKQWDAMTLFFNEEYWRRVWIIQEITVASTVTVLYGDIEFSWTPLVSTLESLVKFSAQERKRHKVNVSDIGARHLLEFHQHWNATDKPISLFQAMKWTLHTKATDTGTRYLPCWDCVTMAFGLLSFSRNRSLDLICLKGTGTMLKENSRLPSWAPNWPNLRSGNITSHEKHIWSSPKTFNFDPVLQDSTSATLKVEAVYVGSIHGISSALETNNGCTQTTHFRQVPKPWIFSTENLRNALPHDHETEVAVLQRRTIWRTLTMMCSGLDIEPDDIDKCFSMLWTPEGRGSIYSTQIIDWIDRNAWFRIGRRTLREWSQIKPRQLDTFEYTMSTMKIWQKPKKLGTEITGKNRVDAWDATNQALEQVLGSGMRLVEIRKRMHHLLIGDFATALVNPHAEVSDEIFLLRGCSFPVALRRTGPINLNRFNVIGGVWLLCEQWGLESYQKWSEGNGEVPIEATVSILDLV